MSKSFGTTGVVGIAKEDDCSLKYIISETRNINT